MADEEDKTVIEGGKEEASPEKSKGKKKGGGKLFLFGGIGIGAIILGVVLALFVIKPMMSKSGDESEGDDHAVVETADSGKGETDKHEQKKPKKKKKKKKGHETESLIYLVKDIVINPAGTGGSRFLSVSFGFELESPELEQEFEKKEVIIRDALITIMSSKTVAQLTDPKQKEVVRYQIKKRVSQLMDTDELGGVYYTDFVLQ